MQAILERADRFLDKELDLKERALVIVAALMLAAVYLFPLWNLTMFAPQYPDGLRMNIYSYKLEGGNHGQDIKEINLLNHYIGMKDLVAEDFTEFKWMPFVVGAIGLLFLRTAVHGRMASLLDVIVLYGYFAAFSLWSFAYKLYSYGHNLAPTAAVKVGPFMPPLFGRKQLANFEVYSYPAAASYALGVSIVLLAVAFWLAWRDKPERPPRSWEQL
jgi:copper chaperone NosL